MSTLDNHLRHLTANERAALETFVAQLRQRYSDNLLRVVLFGSKARGDFDEESDLDLLIVVRFPDEDYWQHRKQIVDMAWEAGFEHSLVLSTVIRTPAEYDQMQRDRLLFYRNIEQDGIELWTMQADALISEPA